MSFSLPTFPILSGSGGSVGDPSVFEKRKPGNYSYNRDLPYRHHQRSYFHSERPRQSSTISEYDDLTETQLISREYSITSSESTSTTNYIHPNCHKYSGSSTSVSGTKFGERIPFSKFKSGSTFRTDFNTKNMACSSIRYYDTLEQILT